jgi:hypothetical protein
MDMQVSMCSGTTEISVPGANCCIAGKSVDGMMSPCQPIATGKISARFLISVCVILNAKTNTVPVH